MSSIKVSGFQGFLAAAVAVAITWASGWGFVDSTRSAWLAAAANAVTALAADGRDGGRSGQGISVRLIM